MATDIRFFDMNSGRFVKEDNGIVNIAEKIEDMAGGIQLPTERQSIYVNTRH